MVLGLVALAVVGFAIYARPQPLLPEASAALQSTPDVEGSTVGSDLVFRPTGRAPTVGLILYPGGKVPPPAYAPAARAIAARTGALVEIVDVPFNFAVFAIDAPDRVIEREPGIRQWAVGGHSLGGAMAAQYVATHPGRVEGLLLWASYSATDLSTSGVQVASIFGALDPGAPRFSGPAARANLPAGTVFTAIEGGNHEQMGWYTGQPDDARPTIDRATQGERVVAASVTFLQGLATP